MDPTLAAIYGTAQVTEEDVEKTAAAELAEKLASGEAELDEDTLNALAEEVLAQEAETTEETVEAAPAEEAEVTEPAAEETAEVEAAAEETEEAAVEEPAEKTAKAEEKEEKKEEAKEEKKEKKAESDELSDEQQKIAEADYLGRVMAHAFVQETREIEKQAAKKVPPSFLAKAKDAVGSAAGKVGKHLADNKKAYAAGAGGTAAGGVAGFLAGKKKEKKASALDTLIAARAAELCVENGVDPAVLTAEPEKQAEAEVNPYDVLAAKVEEGAWELLKSKGLVEETEAPAAE